MYWPNLKQTLKHNLFPGQQEGEEVFLVLRQHWFKFAIRLGVWLLFVGILLALNQVIPRFAPFLLTPPYGDILALLQTIYLMFLILGLLMMWTLYYLNVQIITNERVVDIDQHSLIHHKISEVYLSRMQDVTAEVKGFFPTFLDFGNVHIQTAGETERFVFNNIPNPTAVAKLISDLYDRLPAEEKMRTREE